MPTSALVTLLLVLVILLALLDMLGYRSRPGVGGRSMC